MASAVRLASRAKRRSWACVTRRWAGAPSVDCDFRQSACRPHFRACLSRLRRLFSKSSSNWRMHETELWITKLFNDYLAGVGNTLTGIAGMANQARPWANFVTMQLLVAAIIVVLFADRKSTRLNSSHLGISYAVFCLK